MSCCQLLWQLPFQRLKSHLVPTIKHLDARLRGQPACEPRNCKSQVPSALQGVLADGNPLQEGRDDLLFDACLYFIGPHCFTPMDQMFIKQLSQELTVLPVCAKADAMMEDERRCFQAMIRDKLRAGESHLSHHCCLLVHLQRNHAVFCRSFRNVKHCLDLDSAVPCSFSFSSPAVKVQAHGLLQ